MKLLKAKVNNLESNLHIEIDMERLEDSSKALSYIGIEISDALKLIPTPEENVEDIAETETTVVEEIAQEEKLPVQNNDVQVGFFQSIKNFFSSIFGKKS